MSTLILSTQQLQDTQDQHLYAEQPIGIFDSGIGGLTVARAVSELMPNESIIYFGDTARVPYGDKSAAIIEHYALQITAMLLKRSCKMILIACNSVTAAAHDAIKKYVNNRALLVNVVDPVVRHLAQHYVGRIVGLIGTRQTTKSNIYQRILDEYGVDITLRSLATPLLVPIIEEGFFSHKLIDLALAEYLSHTALTGIDALILGCTHYPVIQEKICKYYRDKYQPQEKDVGEKRATNITYDDILDTPAIVAREVKRQLLQHGLLNMGFLNDKKMWKKEHIKDEKRVAGDEIYRHAGEKYFYVSDYTDAFAMSARLFFGHSIKLQLLSL